MGNRADVCQGSRAVSEWCRWGEFSPLHVIFEVMDFISYTLFIPVIVIYWFLTGRNFLGANSSPGCSSIHREWIRSSEGCGQGSEKYWSRYLALRRSSRQSPETESATSIDARTRICSQTTSRVCSIPRHRLAKYWRYLDLSQANPSTRRILGRSRKII